MSYDPNDDVKLLDTALARLSLTRDDHIAVVSALSRLRDAANAKTPAQTETASYTQASADAGAAPKRRGRPPKAKAANGVVAHAQA